MASKVMPYFILTADGVEMPPSISEEESNDTTSPIDSFGTEKQCQQLKRGTKTKKKALTVSTRTEATKKRMEFIKQKLNESRERYIQKQAFLSKAVPRLNDPKLYLNGSQDGSDKSSESSGQRPVELVPLNSIKNKTSDNPLPYVYFVVSIDRTSCLKPSNDFDFLDGSSFIATKKDRFLTSQSEVKRKRHEERLKIQQEARNAGLNSQPLRKISQKQIAFPSSLRSPPLNPPTTPCTTLTSALYPDKQDDSMILPEGPDISDFLDESRPSTKHCSTRFLELPHISAEEQRKALGTAPSSVDYKPIDIIRKTISQGSSNRRVHFSDGLPLITGSTITFTDFDAMRSNIGSRPSTMPALMDKKQVEEKTREKSQPKVTRSKTSLTFSNKKQSESLNLPKIDIVSNVYNDMIVKAINAYIRQCPIGSHQTKLANQLLQQLQKQKLSTLDLGTELISENIYPKNAGKRMVIKEIDPELGEIIKGHNENSGKMTGNRVKPKPQKDRQYNSLKPKSFKMAPPGQSKESIKVSAH